MNFESTIQAFYGADNGEQDVRFTVDVERRTVKLCQGEHYIWADYIAARTLANAILRELDKQS